MIKLNGKKIEMNSFPDGTMALREKVEVDFEKNRKAYIDWHYENDRELVALIYITGHLRSHGVSYVYLFMPYIPNARMDRVKSDSDVFTLKYFAQVINRLNFDSVTVLDPHSSVSEALIDNIVILNPKEYVDEVIEDITKREGIKPMMFYPDEGAGKRYSGMINLPYAFGIKKRDWATGQIQGLDAAGEVQQISGNNVLIVDDICSRGGTFYHSARKLKELGAKNIYLYITHCEHSIFEGEILKGDLIHHVYTTNSIFNMNNEKITVINCEREGRKDD